MQLEMNVLSWGLGFTGFEFVRVSFFSFLLILEVWVGLGWDSGWDCARELAWDFPIERSLPRAGPPLNSRAELGVKKAKTAANRP